MRLNKYDSRTANGLAGALGKIGEWTLRGRRALVVLCLVAAAPAHAVMAPSYEWRVSANVVGGVWCDFPWGRSAQEHYFALVHQDRVLDDYVDGHPSNYFPGEDMSNIRFHSGEASHGCVTVPGLPDNPNWLPIQEMLKRTRKGAPLVIHGESFPNYGTLTIIGTGGMRRP